MYTTKSDTTKWHPISARNKLFQIFTPTDIGKTAIKDLYSIIVNDNMET